MKRHIFTNYGLTLCGLPNSSVTTFSEEEFCSQCSHVMFMLSQGHVEYLKAIKNRAEKRLDKSF